MHIPAPIVESKSAWSARVEQTRTRKAAGSLARLPVTPPAAGHTGTGRWLAQPDETALNSEVRVGEPEDCQGRMQPAQLGCQWPGPPPDKSCRETGDSESSSRMISASTVTVTEAGYKAINSLGVQLPEARAPGPGPRPMTRICLRLPVSQSLSPCWACRSSLSGSESADGSLSVPVHAGPTQRRDHGLPSRILVSTEFFIIF